MSNPKSSSVRPSIADRIMLCKGQLLPIEPTAFRYSIALTQSMLGSEMAASGITIKQYFENFGIRLTAPHIGAKGWYDCILPSGWTVARLDGNSKEDCLVFYDGTGKHAFTLITSSKPSDTKCILTPIDLSEH